MKSMTGYGYRETATDRYTIYLEIKSYNNRYLDIQVNLPPFYGPLEPRIRERLSGIVERGRVEITCRTRVTEEDIQVQVDTGNAATYAHALRELARAAGIAPDLHVGHLMNMEGIIRFEKNRDLEEFWTSLEPVLDEVTADFEESRLKEGQRTREYILEQLRGIERNFGVIRSNSEKLEELLSRHLRERFREIAENSVDESRIAAETAVLLVKYSIGEEIERFEGHLKNFMSTLNKRAGTSKKLDFICQELNREINTLSSKSFLLEVNQAVVEVKDGIEKIREQLRNVE